MKQRQFQLVEAIGIPIALLLGIALGTVVTGITLATMWPKAEVIKTVDINPGECYPVEKNFQVCANKKAEPKEGLVDWATNSYSGTQETITSPFVCLGLGCTP